MLNISVGTEQGLLQDRARRWVPHVLKTPKLLESFQQRPFIKEMRKGCH